LKGEKQNKKNPANFVLILQKMSTEDVEAMEEDSRRVEGKKYKGRGHSSKMDVENERYSGNSGVFDKIDSDASQVGPQRCT